MIRIEITGDAEPDLIDIYLYGIERFGQVQAEHNAQMLHSKIEMVAENPSIGSDYSFRARRTAALRKHLAFHLLSTNN
ncbi:type II toxin-antitoxin system RelE/ParE family toxin [Roseibium salinum]|uniref:Type II toxin-antitoxin system RelE/ParE family toxin n=1 Tax=Roseibium salinum TaxID=1604349 RepID=A0ABT3R922_9HYPH|nr:type II toxin-antitoxin system RelE/ParE family toxin [Roseibium sp. DSM 29163]MCX2725811.1 type II toxin-antitoxin system RelE/ParE family toxin [Roseibium sp. DSM 29163]MDN3720373.1 type II toxin-antitoxin system RelE/ParE family toxin [Roseibium salinum]